ncbi:MAG: alanine dehydrogenase [Schleiferiaceae bacterium]|nr:alanine dehydrogenase [Schleiferiaceae bacterium]
MSMQVDPTYATQEERLLTKQSYHSMKIGVPLETSLAENRVAITPEGVHMLVSQGHELIVERGAGMAARYSDHAYSEAGAQIADDRQTVFQCPMLLKVEPPSKDELSLMPGKQILFSVLQPNMLTKAYLQAMVDKQMTAISYGGIKDEQGRAPFIRSMAEIAGNQAITVAMEYLSTWSDGKGYVMGGITGVPPTDVVIIGAGTVGTVAAKLATAMGASVKVFDASLSRIKALTDQVGHGIYTCTLQPQILAKALERCDVAIASLRPIQGRTPVVVSEDMVMKMKPRSLIVDISIDHGGCFETSEVTTWDAPVYTRHQVVHFCVPNITSRVARTASFALNNLTSPLCHEIANMGGLGQALRLSDTLRPSVYAFHGTLTDQDMADRFNLPSTPLSLLV